MTAMKNVKPERLSDLAAWCELAPAPDRDLDGQIASAVFALSASLRAGAPAYTASIDAAMTLVPEGWNRSVTAVVGKPPSVRLSNDVSDVLVVHGKTEALALCAAALRARAA